MSTPYWEGEGVTLYHGDCIEVMAEMPDNSVDAIVCDPPYGLGFMGKAWDDLPPGLPWAQACLRVLKPGGHLLAFGGTRTWHRLACAVEDAGFEIRDSIAWLYGSGFPKSLDVSKAIDKAAGAQREVTGTSRSPFRMADPKMGDTYMSTQAGDTRKVDADGYIIRETTAPATAAAQQWAGWGTALKPAFEPVVVARKPLVGTVAGNVQVHGTGALNIDACRIEGTVPQVTQGLSSDPSSWEHRTERRLSNPHEGGRWPANVVLDADQAATLNQQSGTLTSGAMLAGTQPKGERNTYGKDAAAGYATARDTYADSGGASRFFFVSREDEKCLTPNTVSIAAQSSSPLNQSGGSAPDDAATSAHLDTPLPTRSRSTNGKANASGPNETSDTAPTTPTGPGYSQGPQPDERTPTRNHASDADQREQTDTTTTTRDPSTSDGFAGPATSSTTPKPKAVGAVDYDGPRFRYTAKAPTAERPKQGGIAHATVKPIDLMQWLVRLVTPPGGVVLDPFAGSGTTGEATIREGFTSILIEREADYLPLIRERFQRPINYLLDFGDPA
jgi:site-specific DNA-methyltransferase (adenine-specific)